MLLLSNIWLLITCKIKFKSISLAQTYLCIWPYPPFPESLLTTLYQDTSFSLATRNTSPFSKQDLHFHVFRSLFVLFLQPRMFFSQPLLLCLVKAHCPRPKSNVNSLEKLPGEELHGLFLYPNSTLIISQLRCLLHHTVLFVSQAEQCLCSLKSRRLEGGDPCLTQQYTALHLAQDHQDVLIKESKRER